MNLQGHHFSNSSFFAGYPMDAQAATPESNHTSRMSGTLLITPPHLGHLNVTLSIHGLWRSIPSVYPSLPLSSVTWPMTFLSPHLHSHTGMGIPQYLCLEMHQSLAPSTQFFSLVEPAQSGTHLTLSISLSIFSLTLGTDRNHCLVFL